MKSGAQLITESRQEQLDKHGFDAERDSRYTDKQLLGAAIYAITGRREYYPADWDIHWMLHIKKKSEIEQLAEAGALIAAEIDRLQNQKA